ncbi:ImmA/IrrE family metallo-endopeptidase [Roseovarius rhodophyticola]|uniref:ImmA/IrrE family metallo-endopeptidase n=1 Tax=Roseovarius rhodophyticola TaxID=3080827 RepID=A0ABZ2TEJ9_9RHOB|nr:ImmA/IrrE family metallo-endopeptidase [Roseovarius sp. W115]MDV2928398.1 ImmA/IrrE family metallo-endopeptidase [Roseovarius sp. W115]
MTVVNFKHDTRISDSDRGILREFTSELGGDPVHLAHRLGLKVFEENLHESVSGFIQFDETCGSDSGYKVVLNSVHSVARKKFTLAHELGHFVLHRNSDHFLEDKKRSAEIFDFASGYRSGDGWDYSQDFPKAFEREADVFAANVLLPANLLRKTAEFIEGTPASLARRLDLSVPFVARRFEEVRFEA